MGHAGEDIADGSLQVGDLVEGERDGGQVTLATAAEVEKQHVVACAPEARADAEQLVLRAAVSGAADDDAPGGRPRQPPPADRYAIACLKGDRLVLDLE